MIRKTLPILKEAIKGFANHDVFFGRCFKIADLGCSSGPNTLLSATNIIDIVHEECKQNNRKTPQFHVSLVDLVGNDFNTVFGLLPNFYAKLKEDKGKDFGPCFISAVPGSFYDRLFPDESLHLVYSSYSVHWLSQVCIIANSAISNYSMIKLEITSDFLEVRNQKRNIEESHVLILITFPHMCSEVLNIEETTKK